MNPNFNGKANPISYRGETLVWQGNQLMSCGSAQFRYNNN